MPAHTHTLPPPPRPPHPQELVTATGAQPPEGVLPQLAADMVTLADRNNDGGIRCDLQQAPAGRWQRHVDVPSRQAPV